MAKLALVTGGSAGIGLAVARGLSALDHRVIITARVKARGDGAAAEVARATGKRAPEVMEVDFSSQASIRAFGAAFAERGDALDVLVNNAGTWSQSRGETSEGIETVWATNQLGYFLTTEVLRPALVKAPRARVVNVASDLASGLDLTDVEFKRRPYTGIASYAQSKQANRMWTRALARRLSGAGVTVNSLHPGGVATGLFAKGGGMLGRAVGAFVSVFGRTPATGADTAVWLASSNEVEGRTGLFYVDRKERRCRFINEALEEELFALCARMTGVR